MLLQKIPYSVVSVPADVLCVCMRLIVPHGAGLQRDSVSMFLAILLQKPNCKTKAFKDKPSKESYAGCQAKRAITSSLDKWKTPAV